MDQEYSPGCMAQCDCIKLNSPSRSSIPSIYKAFPCSQQNSHVHMFHHHNPLGPPLLLSIVTQQLLLLISQINTPYLRMSSILAPTYWKVAQFLVQCKNKVHCTFLFISLPILGRRSKSSYVSLRNLIKHTNEWVSVYNKRLSPIDHIYMWIFVVYQL